MSPLTKQLRLATDVLKWRDARIVDINKTVQGHVALDNDDNWTIADPWTTSLDMVWPLENAAIEASGAKQFLHVLIVVSDDGRGTPPVITDGYTLPLCALTSTADRRCEAAWIAVKLGKPSS